MEAWVLFVIMLILPGWAHPQIGNAIMSLRPLADSNVIPQIRVEILFNSYDCLVYRVVNDSNFWWGELDIFSIGNVAVRLKDWPRKADTEGR